MTHAVPYPDYVERIRQQVKGTAAQLSEYGQVQENGRTYPLLKISAPGKHSLVVTAGFHGEEPAGPLTLASHLEQILAYARTLEVGVRIYPCINPSGFEVGSRYNASDEKPNNDFLRYHLPTGELLGEIEEGVAFERYSLFRESPKETRALLEELERHEAPRAALDIHQDRYLPGAWAYAYVFGDREPFRKLMAQAQAHATLATHKLVDERRETDSHGLVEYRDGSVTDYFDRRGTRFTATLETTTHTPMEACHQINLLWIRGFIELATQP